ncbi:MAG: hypothetical protein WA061_02460 [Microgenomates group bacterium]
MATFVFEITLNKLGDSTPYKIFHWLGRNTLDVNHEFAHYIYESDEEQYNLPFEITSVRKLNEIKSVENALFYFEEDFESDGMDEEDWDGTEPLTMAKNMSDEKVILFSCECKETLRVAEGNWPYVKCPNCENQILRREIKNAGGLYYYAKEDTEKGKGNKNKK